MRPIRTFLLLLIYLVCFAGLSYILPWFPGLPTVNNLFPANLLQTQSNGHPEPNGTADSLETVLPPAPVQTITVVADSAAADTIAPPRDPMSVFLDGLSYSQSRQLRVLYYGDSQIEGDRITSYIRRYLRKEHGGTGPGLLLPVMPVTYTRSFYVRASSNWKRYNYLSYRNEHISHNDLGPFMAFCRYMPEGAVSASRVKSWIRIVPSVLADRAESQFDYLRIFYRNHGGDVKIEIKSGDNPVITDTLEYSAGMTEYACRLSGSRNILIDFSGNTSPDLYGISIESSNGIVVDNIPQRGSAGLEFTMVGKENLKEAYDLLKPDLVVIHYGLNLATTIRNDYSYFEKGLARQIDLLRDISPETGLLVIGLTDMAFQDGTRVKPYPNIPKIIKAQRNAAESEGAAFWDARTAMGGQSSIVKWFNMNPPLAKPDYVHLTDQGADRLAQLMVKDLFTQRVPDPVVKIPPVVQIDTSALAKQHPVVTVADAQSPQAFLKNLVSDIFSYDPGKTFIFTSPAFWIFFLFVLAGFILFYKKMFVRNFYLLLVSLFFYYKAGGLFLLLLVFVTLIDYTCGLLIYRSGTKAGRRFFLVLSILSNIGLLAYFKYTGFFVQTINDLFGTDIVVTDVLGALSNSLLGTNFDISSIVLPVGISFFTFQSLSYTIDMYRMKLEPVRNVSDFGFYVSFFPQLVAGPIVRASEFIPQLYREYNVTKREFSHAVFLIVKGLTKKIIISDFIAVNFIDRVFELPTAYSGFENLLAVYGYGLQIYCDFSGYTDIAIGVALILGFRLPVNFNSPYKALDLTDFWRRWHISLSRWLKDYLYIPLGGNRKGRVRTLVNLMLTMLIGGLWHGASLRFLIWGGLHGIGLAINKIKDYIFGTPVQKGRLATALSVFLTFNFVSFCWIFFRAQNMHSVVLMLRQIFNDFVPASFGTILHAYSGAFALMAAGYIIHFLPEKFKEWYRGIFINTPLAVQMILVLIAGFLLFRMGSVAAMPFIYFRF
jgi:D-alanyl-lipoteichoic acid acyltransferase DltB (MBOAT superfamily)